MAVVARTSRDLLEANTSAVLTTDSVRAKDGLVDDIGGDDRVHIPDRLARCTCNLSHLCNGEDRVPRTHERFLHIPS